MSLSDAQSLGVCGLSRAVRSEDEPTTTNVRNTKNNSAGILKVPGLVAAAAAVVGAVALSSLA